MFDFWWWWWWWGNFFSGHYGLPLPIIISAMLQTYPSSDVGTIGTSEATENSITLGRIVTVVTK
jgi:hypothetical protein